jgi:hypothetical protein
MTFDNDQLKEKAWRYQLKIVSKREGENQKA